MHRKHFLSLCCILGCMPSIYFISHTKSGTFYHKNLLPLKISVLIFDCLPYLIKCFFSVLFQVCNGYSINFGIALKTISIDAVLRLNSPHSWQTNMIFSLQSQDKIFQQWNKIYLWTLRFEIASLKHISSEIVNILFTFHFMFFTNMSLCKVKHGAPLSINGSLQ